MKSLLILFAINWSANVMAWNCTQVCPSSVLSGALECKTYQLLKCSNKPQSTPPPTNETDNLNGILDMGSCESGDCKIYAEDLPEIKTRANKDGEFIIIIPDAASSNTPPPPKYQENTFIFENQLEDEVLHPYLHPDIEVKKDEGGELVIGPYQRYSFKTKYKKDDNPIIEIGGYTGKYKVQSLNKIVVREVKKHKEVVLYYNNYQTPPVIKPLKKVKRKQPDSDGYDPLADENLFL
jgi:hypothetical protein